MSAEPLQAYVATTIAQQNHRQPLLWCGQAQLARPDWHSALWQMAAAGLAHWTPKAGRVSRQLAGFGANYWPAAQAAGLQQQASLPLVLMALPAFQK